MVWYEEVFLDILFFTKIYKTSIVELFLIVNDDWVNDAESAYDGFLNKVSCFLLGDFGKWFCLGILGEIIHCNDGEF